MADFVRPDEGPRFTLASRPSNDASLDMGVPPRSRCLYGRSGRAALTAGTLTPISDHTSREDMERYVEVRNPHGYYPDAMHGYSGEATAFPSDWVTSADGRPFTVPIESPPLRLEVREGRAALTWDELNHEVLGPSKARRAATIRPGSKTRCAGFTKDGQGQRETKIVLLPLRSR